MVNMHITNGVVKGLMLVALCDLGSASGEVRLCIKPTGPITPTTQPHTQQPATGIHPAQLKLRLTGHGFEP